MSFETTYKQWAAHDNLDNLVKEDMKHLATHPELIEDAFYQPLSFGTAGMRGIIGAGINRMNTYTVRQATTGLALYLETLGEEAKNNGVVIAYDSRHQSPEFSMIAAEVLASHGIKAYVFESLRPTPELSFAVRYLGCAAGIMVTASHNPPAYNGYKVYGPDGGQIAPDFAEQLTGFIKNIDNPLIIELATAEQKEAYVTMVGKEIDEAYLEAVKTVTVNPELVKRSGSDLSLVFSPLHGTGAMLGERALVNAGFTKVTLVPEQAIPDPDFTTVVSPNPEEEAAFEYAKTLGQKVGAELLVATDPDADRMGAAILTPKGTYQILTGNQLGTLMIDYILKQLSELGELPQNGKVVKSIVSSDLPTRVCQKHNVEMINVLTGFKFIAEKIESFETEQSGEFLFGFEESYGYLVKSFARDKDAVQAMVLLAEVAVYYKEKGMTLYDALIEIYEEFGYFEEKTMSVTLAGKEGQEKIQEILTSARNTPATEFGSIKVLATEDYQTKERQFTDGSKESIDLPSSNVLKYLLADGSWVAIRPSGTEPKIKFYISTVGTTAEEATNKRNMFMKDIELLTK